MNEQNHLRVFALFLFLLVVMSVSTASFAAVTTTPSVSGYARDSVSGGYLNNAAGTGQRLFDGAARAYSGEGDFNVGGKKMTVPAKIPLSASAGTIAKNAMRLNPWVLAGSLALPWLIENGMEWIDGEWKKKQLNTDGFTNCSGSACTGQGCNALSAMSQSAVKSAMVSYLGAPEYSPTTWGSPGWNANALASEKIYDKTGANRGSYSCLSPKGADSYSPSTDSDWDALPDPIPTVGSELPDAPYMAPKGAPVDAPNYDFAPYDAPTGAPYKKPDGSTVQPMVSVSPNGTNVTYNTYNTTTINAAGQPVVDAPPSDEGQDEIKDPCDLNPDRIGCSKYGEAAAEIVPTTVIPVDATVAPVGGSGSCPADVVTSQFGITWSYQPICDFASAVRPFIIGFAWLSFAYIVVGAVRS